MNAKIHEIEVILDKLNLLFDSVKKDGTIDRIEGELLRKYVHQLQDALGHVADEKKAEIKMPEAIVPIVEKQEMKQEAIKEEVVVIRETIRPEIKQEVIVPEVKPELKEEIKKIPEVKPVIEAEKKSVKKPLVKEADHEEEEENYTSGLHNKLHLDKKTLAEKITTHKAKDLKKIIHLNDRLFLVKELFNGDASLYEREITVINNMTSLISVEHYIQKELHTRLKWDDTESVDRFVEIVKVKFE